MNMHWIADLKQHMRELQQQILIFCEEYPIQHPDEKECLEILLNNTDKFEAWVRALPSDADVSRWVDWPAAFCSKVSLTQLETAFDVLVMLSEEADLNNHQAILPRASIVREQINLVSGIHQESRIQHDDFRWSPEAEIVRLPAYIVLSALWPVYYWTLDRTLNLSVFEMQNWSDVLYHPYYTPVTLYQVIAVLALANPNLRIKPFVTPRKGDDAFEICITHPTMYMIPALWLRILAIDSNGDLERLRELGGSIDPLTWDEGQGQGVIVRLPWAEED